MDNQGTVSINQINPLLVDLILKNIFDIICANWDDKLAIQTLIECRQVCCKWEEHARIKIQSLAKIKFKASYEVNSDQDSTDPSHSLLPAYMAYLQSDPMLRFNNFEFEGLSMMHNQTRQFLSDNASIIKYLSLYFDYEQVEGENGEADLERSIDAVTLRQIIVSTGRTVQHLKLGHLPIAIIENRLCSPEAMENFSTNAKKLTFVWQSEGIVAFYWDLLCSVPSLERLRINNEYEDDDDSETELSDPKFSEFISMLPTIAATFGYRLRHLESYKPARLHNIFLLSPLRLTTLTLGNIDISNDGTEFTRFLQFLSATLKSLRFENLFRVISSTDVDVIPVKFPVLPNLLDLKLHLFDCYTEANSTLNHFSPLNFKEIFPKLKVANFFIPYSMNTIFSGRFNVPFTTLDTLRLNFRNMSMNEIISKIVKANYIFPKIRKLGLEQGSLLEYRLIWSLWPHLESLTIKCCTYLDPDTDSSEFLTPDCFLTGLSENTCRSIRDSQDVLSFQCDEELTSIANLKKLRHLTMQFYGYGRGTENIYGQLLNVSIWALVKLPHLEFIQLPRINQINEAGMQILYEAFPSIRIETKK